MNVWGVTKLGNRSADQKLLKHVRELAVARVLAGDRPEDVAKSLGVDRTTVYKWVLVYKKGGREALKCTTVCGPQPKLTDRRKQQVRRWIVGKSPTQYGYDCALWTRSIIAEMIRFHFGVSLTLPSIARLLDSLDILAPKPLQNAMARDRKAIQKWKSEVCSELKEQARQRGAEILFLDLAEATTCSPAKAPAQLRGKNAISFVNCKGSFWCKLYQGTLTPTLFAGTIEDLIKACTKPVVLITDNLQSHFAELLASYASVSEGRLSIYSLPGTQSRTSPLLDLHSNESCQPSLP